MPALTAAREPSNRFLWAIEPNRRSGRLNLGRPSDLARVRAVRKTVSEGAMWVRITGGRLLGFDLGDWSLLAAGLTVAGLLVLLA